VGKNKGNKPMENTIYLGLSRQMTLQTKLDVIANNVANMSTPGYRGQNLLFSEYVSKPRGSTDSLSFVYDPGQYQNTESGSVSYTENPLDIYLSGPGFMGVQGPDGINYTRAGNLEMRADGTLITSAGFPVAGAGGGAIVVPANSREISIDENGFVSNQDGQLGQLMIMEFENLQELKPLGNNLYKTDAAGAAAENTVVRQGALEGSNVNPVLEMTRMIDALRSFQNVHNIMNSENERLRTAIQQLTRTS
jgi:flagellar basal-body rod protein FlgF